MRTRTYIYDGGGFDAVAFLSGWGGLCGLGLWGLDERDVEALGAGLATREFFVFGGGRGGRWGCGGSGGLDTIMLVDKNNQGRGH